VDAAVGGSSLGIVVEDQICGRNLARHNRKKAHDHRGIPRRPADRSIAGPDGSSWSVAMGPAPVPAAYHRPAPGSGDIPIPHDGQLHVSHPMGLAQDGLSVKEDGDAVVAQERKATAADHILTASPSYLADIPPPTTAVARTVPLPANDRAVSHISLSTRRSWVAGK
jgi:hypothetical protein